MKVFYFHCNFQPHQSTLPKMGKCFTTIVGQSDWSRHYHWLSCLTYGQSRRHWEAYSNNAPSPLKL